MTALRYAKLSKPAQTMLPREAPRFNRVMLKELEARVGIEPTNKGFADPCLTTWLPRQSRLTHSNDTALRPLQVNFR